jgi:pyrroline-5-carboxylate reductase
MKIAVIGCGVMGKAFARFLSKKHDVLLVSKNKEKIQPFAQEIGASVASAAEAMQTAEMIFLGFKPKDLSDVVDQLGSVPEGKIIVSMLAGTTTALLQKVFPCTSIVRIMPNLALTVEKGVIGIIDAMDPLLKKQVSEVLEGMGMLYFLPESKMDAFTALCGSSPAFIFVILEALIEGAVSLGFTFTDARDLLLQVIDGCVQMVKTTNQHPAELKMLITSPGGTTIAGLTAMERHAVRFGLIQTLVASYHRSQEMSRI